MLPLGRQIAETVLLSGIIMYPHARMEPPLFFSIKVPSCSRQTVQLYLATQKTNFRLWRVSDKVTEANFTLVLTFFLGQTMLIRIPLVTGQWLPTQFYSGVPSVFWQIWLLNTFSHFEDCLPVTTKNFLSGVSSLETLFPSTGYEYMFTSFLHIIDTGPVSVATFSSSLWEIGSQVTAENPASSGRWMRKQMRRLRMSFTQPCLPEVGGWYSAKE